MHRAQPQIVLTMHALEVFSFASYQGTWSMFRLVNTRHGYECHSILAECLGPGCPATQVPAGLPKSRKWQLIIL